jgi:hypothetical protein
MVRFLAVILLQASSDATKLKARVKRQCLRSVILTCEREEASKNAADMQRPSSEIGLPSR